mgnify:CR=1 FL=1
MGARGLLHAIEVSWVNAESLGLIGVEVWGSVANNRALAVRLAVPPVVHGAYQTWVAQGLMTGDTWYFWTRSLQGNGAVSTWTPSDPLAGWGATVMGVENTPYDLAYGDTMKELRWLLEQLVVEIRTMREVTEQARDAQETLVRLMREAAERAERETIHVA